MKNIFAQTVAAVILIFIVTSCFWEDNPKPVYDPQTIEEVITQREYYFTCYMNDELWYTNTSTWTSLTHQVELSMYLQNYPINEEEDTFSTISITAYKNINPNGPNWSSQTFNIEIWDPVQYEFDNLFDTLPYEFFFDNYTTQFIHFKNGFYTEEFINSIETSERDEIIRYYNVSDFHFWLDSITIEDYYYVAYGRIEGNFANAKGDTLRITEGVFKVKHDD